MPSTTLVSYVKKIREEKKFPFERIGGGRFSKEENARKCDFLGESRPQLDENDDDQDDDSDSDSDEEEKNG